VAVLALSGKGAGGRTVKNGQVPIPAGYADLPLASQIPVLSPDLAVFGGKGCAVQLADIRPRVNRLEQLAKGLAKEVSIIRAADDPLLYRERKQYLTSIQDARAGADAARVILARAAQRLERTGTTG
jgi:hypothetical protein